MSNTNIVPYKTRSNFCDYKVSLTKIPDGLQAEFSSKPSKQTFKEYVKSQPSNIKKTYTESLSDGGTWTYTIENNSKTFYESETIKDKNGNIVKEQTLEHKKWSLF